MPNATPPRQLAIDRVLWRVLVTPHAFLQVIMWLSLVFPLIVASGSVYWLAVSARPLWLAAIVYLATLHVAISAGQVIKRSHVRLLAWREWSTREERHSLVATTKEHIEQLIKRDKARDLPPWNE